VNTLCRSLYISALAGAMLAGSLAAQPPAYQGHGAGSVSHEVVAKYAPPPLPAEVSRRIQMALDLRAPGLGQLTPDGKRLFFGWAITGVPNVWRLDGAKSFPVQMTGGEDRTLLADITPGGRYLVLTRDVGGQEDPGLYLQPVAGGAVRKIQHLPGSRVEYGFTSRDGRYLYFGANDLKPDAYALYRFDLEKNEKELLLGEPGLWSIVDRREDGAQVKLLVAKATGALTSEIYELDLADRKLVPLLGQGEAEEYSVAYAAAPDEILVQTNKFGDFRRLYRWSKARGFVAVTPEMKMDVAGFSIDAARQHVYYVTNDGGYSRVHALSAADFRELALPDFPGADHVYAGNSTPDGRFVILGVETSRAPRASYVLDWQSGQVTQWIIPSAPEADLASFAVARLEHYPARDGTSIPMFVRYPKGCEPETERATPCPVVVEFHGGPEGQVTPGFSAYAQLFVDAGLIFMQPNVRGSDGYGKAWLAADDGPKRLAVVTDIDDAGQYARRHFTRHGIAPKVGISGGSYGGYSTLIGMTMFAGTFDAGASIVGISDLVTFLNNTAPYRRKLRASEYGDPEKDLAALQKLSPVTYLDQVKGPILMIQGVDDPRVPVGEAIQMHEKMKAKGLASQLILMEGEGHGAARRGSQVVQIGHTLRFLEEQLLGKKAGS